MLFQINTPFALEAVIKCDEDFMEKIESHERGRQKDWTSAIHLRPSKTVNIEFFLTLQWLGA